MAQDIPVESGNVVDFQRRLRALDMLRSRLDYASQHGFQFGTDRDIYKALGYPRAIQLQDYRDAYQRGGISKRIVDAAPQATWRGDVRVFEPGPRRRMTGFERGWDELNTQLKLTRYFERVDRIAGLGRYAILFLGFNDGRAFDSAVSMRRGRERRLNYVSVFSEENASVERFVEDPRDPRFGLPQLYSVKLAPDGATQDGRRQRQAKEVLVHHSRVIHVADNLLENDVYGIPRLQPVWNLLHDLLKVTGGSAEMFWRGGYQGLQFDVDKDSTLTEEEIADMDEQLKEWEHNQRRAFQTRGIEINSLPVSVADPRGNFEIIVSQISGTTGIPQRILMGSEMGRLASQQDRLNWGDRIDERRGEFAEPCVARAAIDRLVEFGVLPAARNGYELEWPDVVALTDDERSANAQRYGQATLALSGQQIVTTEEARENWFGLPAEPSGSFPPPVERPEGSEMGGGDNTESGR